MNVRFKKYDEKARIPEKAYEGDFCYDVYAVSEEEIAPNVWKYGLGFGLQIIRGMEWITKYGIFDSIPEFGIDLGKSPLNLSIDIRPRSSVWKTGMVLSNCQGTVN